MVTRVNDTVLCICKLPGCGPVSPVENHCSKLIKRDHLPWCLKAHFLGPVRSRAVSAATRWEGGGHKRHSSESYGFWIVEICSGAPRRLPMADGRAKDTHGHSESGKKYTRAKDQVFSSRCLCLGSSHLLLPLSCCGWVWCCAARGFGEITAISAHQKSLQMTLLIRLQLNQSTGNLC